MKDQFLNIPWTIPEKSRGGSIQNFWIIEDIACENSRKTIKEPEYPGVKPTNLVYYCRISRGLGVWAWNFLSM